MKKAKGLTEVTHSRSFFNDLLVPSLHTTVPLKQVKRVSMLVGKHLHFNMPAKEIRPWTLSLSLSFPLSFSLCLAMLVFKGVRASSWSINLGLTRYFSIRTLSSPNDFWLSLRQDSSNCWNSSPFLTTRIPCGQCEHHEGSNVNTHTQTDLSPSTKIRLDQNWVPTGTDDWVSYPIRYATDEGWPYFLGFVPKKSVGLIITVVTGDDRNSRLVHDCLGNSFKWNKTCVTVWLTEYIIWTLKQFQTVECTVNTHKLTNDIHPNLKQLIRLNIVK